MKLVILGGGISGVSSAMYAAQKGIEEISLIEQETSLGGLHQDFNINGYHFDAGAFVFEGHHQVFTIFPELKNIMHLNKEFNQLSLTSKGNFDSYPITIKGYIKEWGIYSSLWDLINLISIRLKADDAVYYYLGNFYQKTGLRHYMSRLYASPPEQIGIQFFTKRLSFVSNLHMRNYDLISKILRLKLLELNKYYTFPFTEPYTRPISGFTTMYNLIEEKLNQQKVSVHLETQIKEISIDNKFIITNKNEILNYDYLICSIPLLKLCHLCDIRNNLKTNYKKLCSLFYVSKDSIFPKNCQVLFNFTNIGLWKRITLHSHYYGIQDNHHYFTVELIPDQTNELLNHEDLINSLDQNFRTTVTQVKHTDQEWVNKVKQIQLVGSHITPNAYPIYPVDFDLDSIEQLKQNLQKKGIYLVGRQGEFNYISSSDAVESSVNAIDNILNQSILSS